MLAADSPTLKGAANRRALLKSAPPSDDSTTVETFALAAFPELKPVPAGQALGLDKMKSLFLSDTVLRSALADSDTRSQLGELLRRKRATLTVLLGPELAAAGATQRLLRDLLGSDAASCTLVSADTGELLGGQGQPAWVNAVEQGTGNSHPVLLIQPGVTEAISCAAEEGAVAPTAVALGSPEAGGDVTLDTLAVAVEVRPKDGGALLRLMPQSLLLSHPKPAQALLTRGVTKGSCTFRPPPTFPASVQPPPPPPPPSPPPPPPPLPNWQACTPVFGACAKRNGKNKVPYTLGDSVVTRTGDNGWLEAILEIPPVEPVAAASETTYALMILTPPLCEGSLVYGALLPAGSSESGVTGIAAHYDTYTAPATPRTPATDCTVFKVAQVELSPEQAALPGNRLLLRFRPNIKCPTLADICGDMAGPGTCVYALASTRYEFCPIHASSFTTST